ncbi:MAG: Hsp20/alpha crystallin family protein [Pseudomonadota bacterium]
MEPFKRFGSQLGHGVARVWETLSEGWHELLGRSGGALTSFSAPQDAKSEQADGRSQDDFPRWGLLAAETWETASHIIIRLEVAGVRKEDLDVGVAHGIVRIRGEKRSTGEAETRHYHLMERAYGSFQRNIELPGNVDETAAEVTLADGVVTVILPKLEVRPPAR